MIRRNFRKCIAALCGVAVLACSPISVSASAENIVVSTSPDSDVIVTQLAKSLNYYVHSDVDITSCKVTVDGNNVQSSEYTDADGKVGYTFTPSKEGKYKIVVEDADGESATLTAVFQTVPDEKVKPVITYKGKKCNGTKYFNKWKTIKVTDSDSGLASVKVKSKTNKLNGEKKFTQDIYKDGTYKVSATDKAGNSATATLIVDTKKPKIDGVKDGQHGGDVYVTCSDTGSGLKSITDNGTEKYNGYTGSFTVSAAGTHVLIATDKAGNKTKVTFTIGR